jgi:uncharacterized protein
LNGYADTSVIVPLFINEPASAAATQWFERNPAKLAVSPLAIGEFNSVFAKYVRKGAMDEIKAIEIVAQFTLWRRNLALSVEHQNVDFEVAANLVKTPFPRLLMPDALHLATCKRLNLTLVTLDKDLLTIAAREGVAAVSPI